MRFFLFQSSQVPETSLQRQHDHDIFVMHQIVFASNGQSATIFTESRKE